VSGEHRVDRGTTTDALEQQRRVVAALCDPRAYPHPVTAVRLVETHISFVLLTGQYAYKLKKPLALGFLDFSTLATRRFFCGEELRLNGRLAPRLYLDVVAITGKPDRPQLGGTGPVLDYAVRMVEFPQSALLDTMLARGALTPPLVDALAEAVARFHGRDRACADRQPVRRPGAGPRTDAAEPSSSHRCSPTTPSARRWSLCATGANASAGGWRPPSPPAAPADSSASATATCTSATSRSSTASCRSSTASSSTPTCAGSTSPARSPS
jgi:hypothetical protein